jgi:hypothetical protein
MVAGAGGHGCATNSQQKKDVFFHGFPFSPVSHQPFTGWFGIYGTEFHKGIEESVPVNHIESCFEIVGFSRSISMQSLLPFISTVIAISTVPVLL